MFRDNLVVCSALAVKAVQGQSCRSGHLGSSAVIWRTVHSKRTGCCLWRRQPEFAHTRESVGCASASIFAWRPVRSGGGRWRPSRARSRVARSGSPPHSGQKTGLPESGPMRDRCGSFAGGRTTAEGPASPDRARPAPTATNRYTPRARARNPTHAPNLGAASPPRKGRRMAGGGGSRAVTV